MVSRLLFYISKHSEFQIVLLLVQPSNVLVNRGLCYRGQNWKPSWSFLLTKCSTPTS